MAEQEDALKLLGRVADAFDNPASRESRKDRRIHRIKTCRSHASHGQESQVQLARYAPHCESFLAESFTRISPHDNVLYTCDNTSDLDVKQCDDITKMQLASSSPLSRLNNLARVELKKAGWFERSDQWSIVNMGLPTPTTPKRRHTSFPPTPPDILSPITPSTPAITATRPPIFTPTTPSPCSSSSHDSFLDILSYAPYGEPVQPKRFGVGSRVKDLVKRILHIDVGAHTDRRWRRSLFVGLRPASTARVSGTWVFANLGSPRALVSRRRTK
ncbi:hypothetical protein K503DRAFT_802572 [Rhizopogon vinicolor AM-OR11-026]|uniref:Uncharacterized protein n=1 Tax=Rhizopogon vinicolor AM-OR11-026 TaxID=1314800 RepID=A0A1B7MT14_9AGAM|nr:hypothetical protein K503DRAFT_802572 [Rhizopogon vinicolor AM-OR11-026]